MGTRAGYIVLIVGALLWGGWRFGLPVLWSSGSGAPINLDLEPEQTPLTPPEQVRVTRGGRTFTIEKTHRYVVQGEVLSSTSYDLAWSNDFFDVDVGLIWGPRREEFKKRFTFQQMGRWLFWRTNEQISEQDRADIGTHISNNHLIPAEGRSRLASAARWVSTGDRVRLEGYLVRVLDEGGRALTASSTSRSDTGDGACEVIWVDSLQINKRVYR